MSKFTCEQLGACQGDNPACQMCAIERETRRQAQEAEQLTVWDHVMYWTAVVLAGVATVILIAGFIGYASIRFGNQPF